MRLTKNCLLIFKLIYRYRRNSPTQYPNHETSLFYPCQLYHEFHEPASSTSSQGNNNEIKLPTFNSLDTVWEYYDVGNPEKGVKPMKYWTKEEQLRIATKNSEEGKPKDKRSKKFAYVRVIGEARSKEPGSSYEKLHNFKLRHAEIYFDEVGNEKKGIFRDTILRKLKERKVDGDEYNPDIQGYGLGNFKKMKNEGNSFEVQSYEVQVQNPMPNGDVHAPYYEYNSKYRDFRDT